MDRELLAAVQVRGARATWAPKEAEEDTSMGPYPPGTERYPPGGPG